MSNRDTLPPRELVQRLELEAMDHPYYEEIHSKPWCSGAELLFFDRDEIAKTKLEGAIKHKIVSSAPRVREAFRFLIYFTAASEPEPLSGHGEMHAFVFHPNQDRMVHAGPFGGWRS